jgi:hypothetical protein
MKAGGLFSILGFLVIPLSAAIACDTSFLNQTTVTYNNLQVTFATDRLSYSLGDSVRFYLCFENTGVGPFSHQTLYNPQDAYRVVADSCLTQEDPDCWEDAPFLFPWLGYLGNDMIVIPPGGNWAYEQTWDGRHFRTRELPLPGLYAVLGGLHDDFGNLDIPPNGVRLSIVLGDTTGVAVENATWGEIKARYAP